jgi:hypothetical protein
MLRWHNSREREKSEISGPEPDDGILGDLGPAVSPFEQLHLPDIV